MRLTKEKLIAAWRIRKRFFNDPANNAIIDRFNKVNDLFQRIITLQLSYDEIAGVFQINNKDLCFKTGEKPSTKYFSCKEDEVTAPEAFTGVRIMSEKFQDEYKDLILDIGSLLGGFTFDERHIMKDEYRIISNTITSGHDMGSLNSVGQTRHPSSHFADNNYFFNVINVIHEIKNNSFNPDTSSLVLRWPTEAYYTDDQQAETSQKEALRYRFPYKYFYMWTHDVLHPVSLLAYRNLVRQDENELIYESDIEMNQDFCDFVADSGWSYYSNAIKNIIPEEERGDNFWCEMSKLISVIMIRDQQMKNIQELLEIGNRAIILYGPPGTGKTYHAEELVCLELGISKDEMEEYKFDCTSNSRDKGAWTLVQFHPNYTYEDFIGGISPNLIGNTLSYTLKEGIFKKLCDTADQNHNKKYIIIIDEINRADLSSVFGELMYALEYRGKKVSIPNFPTPFKIPSNVYIIGTMNSIDKSLVTFDLALRRRFGFFKIMPNVAVLDNIMADYNIEDSCLAAFIKRCIELNDCLTSPSNIFQLSKDYQIGHAYFGKIKDFLKKCDGEESIFITTFDLEKLWEYHLQPLIEEYIGNRIDDNDVLDNLNRIKDDFTKPLI